MFFEIFTAVITLALDRFRPSRIHSKEIGIATVKLRCPVGQGLAQMTGTTRAVITGPTGHGGMLQGAIDGVNNLGALVTGKKRRQLVHLNQIGM